MGNKLSINKSPTIKKIITKCYCQRELTKSKINIDCVCINCCKEIPRNDQHYYACRNNVCLDKSMAMQTYVVCGKCYVNDNVPSDISSDLAGFGFIYSKFMLSLHTISYLYNDLLLYFFIYHTFFFILSFF